jgi:galactokinase
VIDPERLGLTFRARFGRAGRVYRAPGRVNLIGEHTDYNDGFVMPIALDRSTWVAAAPRRDRTIVVRSEDLGDEQTIDLDSCAGGPTGRWIDYVRGVASILDSAEIPRSTGRVCGADMLIASDVPIGAGLSSSAALEVACAIALVDLTGASMDPTAMAEVCQRAEHAYAGTQCGIMDQMIACLGRQGHALLLDTRTLACAFVPLPAAAHVLICNTMVRHELASGEYNRRRADCGAGVAVLQRAFPGIRALRDATLEQIDAVRSDLPPRVHARCHHVITENDRVRRAAAALASGRLAEFGALMHASHASLRDDYEVSCPELDVMADIVTELDGVFGARMTGGGFGGCVVALLDAAAATDAVRQTIAERYEGRTGRRPDVWLATAGEGASAWSPVRV